MKLPFKTASRLVWRDARQAAIYVRQWFAWHGLLVLLCLVLLVVIGIALLLPADEALLSGLRFKSTSVKQFANQLSYFGDFAGFNVALFVVLQIVGWARRSRLLLRVAVASLLCAMASGLTANVLRSATGRPRPSANVADMLHGPRFSSDYHALPSAHTATAFGGALPVLMSMPVVGAPLTLVAAAVGWSRMQLNRHHLTDVLASIIIAFVFSMPFSRWALRWPPPSRTTLGFIILPANALTPARRPY